MLEIFKKRQRALLSSTAVRQAALAVLLDIDAEWTEAELTLAGKAAVYLHGQLLDSDSRTEIERRLENRQQAARIFSEAQPRLTADAATVHRVKNVAVIERAALLECEALLTLLHGCQPE